MSMFGGRRWRASSTTEQPFLNDRDQDVDNFFLKPYEQADKQTSACENRRQCTIVYLFAWAGTGET